MGKISFIPLLCLGIPTIFQMVFSDQSCQLMSKPKLQISFVAAYSLNRNTPKGWMRFQLETVRNLMNEIQPIFPETEYSVTGFVDYDDTTIPHDRNITDPELCYFVVQPFTKDKSLTIAAFQSDKGSEANSGIGDDDSITTAMMMAALDKNLKWNNGFYDSKGKTVRKIMIPMVFRKITKRLEKPGNRTIPKADGTDTCSTAIPPKMSQLNKVLYEQNIAVFNSILNSPYGGQWLNDYYRNEFGSLLVPYYQFPIPESHKEAVKNSKFNFQNYAKTFVQKIKEEVMTCDWEEPKGYNSLGL